MNLSPDDIAIFPEKRYPSYRKKCTLSKFLVRGQIAKSFVL